MENVNQNGHYGQETVGRIRTKAELELFFRQGHRHCGAACLRFILMAFVCFYNCGFPEPTGIIAAISGFATPCFYILSGYFILLDDNARSIDKTKRKIKRTFFCFSFMFLIYILINILISMTHQIPISFSLRSVFNFLVLNLWPLSVGSNIWFIQAMLTAYILIYTALKLNLMRFYKPVLIASMILMLLSGEFAGLIHFNIAGYPCIPGNWFTRAIPYILLGKLLREKEEHLLRTAAWKYIAVWIAGALLSLTEIYILVRTDLLVYEGHMIGYGIMAFAACGLAISNPFGAGNRLTSFLTYSDPRLSNVIYMLMDPVFYIIVLISGSSYLETATRFGGLAAYALSILFALVLQNTKLIKAMNS